MARIRDRQNAIELRKQGKTYGQISNELRITKSTLSGWLGDYPLSE
jgi:orotate phosphoribosyltransferase-like protein